MTETAKSIFDELMSDISDELDKREGSVVHTVLAPVAQAMAGLYTENESVLSEAYVDTASLDKTILKAKERKIEYLDETRACIEAVILLADGDSLEGGERFFDAESGVFFAVDSASTEKSETYLLICEEFGTIGNIESGTLVFDGRGITVTSAEITGIITYGRNAETVESLKQRYYDSFEASAFGGNKTDYKEKCLTVTGVGGVQVRRAWNGGGTVKLVIVGSDYEAVSDDMVNDVQNLFDPIVDGVHTGEGIYSVIGHTVTVCSADETAINIVSTIEYENDVSWADVADNVKKALQEYFASLCKTWAESGKAVVRIGKIEAALASVSGVVDAYDTTINESPSNIVFDGDRIPVLGTVNGE